MTIHVSEFHPEFLALYGEQHSDEDCVLLLILSITINNIEVQEVFWGDGEISNEAK